MKCKCGCEEEVKEGNSFISGHNTRIRFKTGINKKCFNSKCKNIIYVTKGTIHRKYCSINCKSLCPIFINQLRKRVKNNWDINKETLLKTVGFKKGYKQTEQHSLNNSLSHKGQKAWNEGLTKEDPRVLKNITNGHNTRRLKDNYKHGSETIVKMHQSMKKVIEEGRGNPFKRGENNPAWNDGSSFGEYGLEFNNELKEQIRKRDNFKCQECEILQEQLRYKLPIHHIDYNKKNNNPNNLISLCKSCHSQTNFNRNDWEKYFKEKLK